MKVHRSLFLFLSLTIVLGFATLLMAHRSAAAARKGSHLKLVDFGTLGGPHSSFFFPNRILNEKESAAAFSDSDVAVTASNGGFSCLDAFISHAVVSNSAHVKKLLDLSAGGCSVPVAINDKEQIVGIAERAEIDSLTGVREDRAVLWSNGQVHDLGTLGGNQSLATALNGGGQIAGWAENNIDDSLAIMGGGKETRAFLWSDGRMLDLGTLGGPDAAANFLNNQGVVVGDSYLDQNIQPTTGLPTVVPFLWRNGMMENLGNLGGTFGEALMVNDSNQVLGTSDLVGDQTFHPTFWQNGHLTDLTTSSKGGKLLTGNWLTEHGIVVGAGDFSAEGGPVFGGALWKNGVLTNVDKEDSACGVEAWAANERGQVVGIATCASESHAWIWSNGHAVNLNHFLPAHSPIHLVYAVAISDEGDVAGIGVPPGVSDADALTKGHAFVLLRTDEDRDADENLPAAAPLAAAAAPAQTAPLAHESRVLSQGELLELHNQVEAKLRPFALRQLAKRRANAIGN